ncbi:hypothetical protein GON05_23700 [Paenibacillus sp. MAH-34]|uniref:Cysteine-rich CPCC domain-containing protein n=2 Tax=Paenibacillus anseongense TaxID=2682845 RepID=A0ABW9UBW6_9BACL|nr:hypothetical protein [Paenibacillus anseongense]
MPQYMENGLPMFNICDCCGFQAGFDDDAKNEPESIEQYRKRWVDYGSNWFSSKPSKPQGWNLEEQLKKIGVDL